MLLLFSSNSSRRYGDDVIRALAHPAGDHFQFRYALRHIAPQLKHRAQVGTLKGEDGLIVFLNGDLTPQPKVTLTAVRAVKVVKTEMVGSSCILTLAAGAYVVPSDDAALRAMLTPAEHALLPHYQSGPHPKGSYVLSVDQAIGQQLARVEADEMTAFEKVAEALSKFDRFGADKGLAFYAVRGLVLREEKRDRQPAPYANGRYQLRSGNRYDLEVYSYSAHDASAGPVTRLALDSDEKAVRFTSAKELALDSRYELNRFSFTTDELINAMPAPLRLALSVPGTDPDKRDLRCDIVLETRFKGWWPRIWARIALIGAGTAFPAIIAVAYKDQMKWWIALIMLASALIAGWGSVFPAVRKN